MNPLEVSDIILYILDIFKDSKDTVTLLRLNVVNKQYNFLTNLDSYQLPQIYFRKTLTNSIKNKQFLQSINTLFISLDIPLFLHRHICKNDANIINEMINEKFIPPYIIFDRYRIKYYVRNIIKNINNWSLLWLTSNISYELLEDLYILLNKIILKKITLSIAIEDQVLISDQLLIKSIKYLDRDNVNIDIDIELYANDMICVIKIIYMCVQQYNYIQQTI